MENQEYVLKPEECVLAIYHIQGKQDFIYKSNKMQQISGASLIIRDCFKKFLIPAYNYDKVKIQKKAIYNPKSPKDSFNEDVFRGHINDGYVGEVIYEGGGNCYILYKDITSYYEINKIFYRKLLEKTYSLSIITSYIKGVNFDDFKKDWDSLEKEHRKRKARNSNIYPVNALPIVQVDDRNYMPLAETVQIGKIDGEGKIKEPKMVKVSYEASKKYEKFRSFWNQKEEDVAKEIVDKDDVNGKNTDTVFEFISGERFLDNIVTERGEESLLAVIYIDGNNMGARVKNCVSEGTYEQCVKKLREYSDQIKRLYIDNRLDGIKEILDTKKEDKRRFVIYAGDEITFICNARHAYDAACEYLEGLYNEQEVERDRRTSCAGICIFHSHMPFAEAYKIAEECCSSAKKKMQKEGIENASLLDFHYCQGAIGTSLEDIREHEGCVDISRPWFIIQDHEKMDGKNYITKETVEKMKKELKKLGKSNIKDLMFAAKKGQTDFEIELERIKAHYKDPNGMGELNLDLSGEIEKETQRKLIYDMVMVYDLWFSHAEEVKVNE